MKNKLPNITDECKRAGICETESWVLTSEELRQTVSLVKETKVSALKPKQFFIAWHGVPTLVFENFGPEILDLKIKLENILPRLAEENQGSKWPKITLGALNNNQTLTNEEALTLYNICCKFKTFQPASIKIKEAVIVAFKNRSLEKRWLSFPISFKDASEIGDPAKKAFIEHKKYVENLLSRFSPSEISRGLINSTTRLSRYTEPHSEFSLVLNFRLDKQPEQINAFINEVDKALPGRHAWFNPESRHVTIRALNPKT